MKNTDKKNTRNTSEEHVPMTPEDIEEISEAIKEKSNETLTVETSETETS